MNQLPLIENIASLAAARRRRQRGWTGLWWGVVAGACLYLVALATFKLAPISYSWVQGAGIVAIALLPVGFFYGWMRQITPIQSARWLDARVDLQERLGTALEFSRQPKTTEWTALVIADAAQKASTIDLRQLLPWRLPEGARWALLFLALVAGVGFVPEFRSPQYLQKQKTAAAVKDAGRQLAQLSRMQLDARKPIFEQTQKAIQEVGELGTRMQQAKLTRDDALKELANAAERLKDELRDFSKTPALRRLEKAARTPSGSTQQSSDALQKQMDALQKQLGDKQTSSDSLDQLRKDLQNLKEAAKGMADKEGANSASSRAELAKAAAELSRKAEALGQPLPSLDEAVAALNAAQVEQFLRDLNTAEQDLEKLAEMSKTLAQLQQQAEKIGKNLAEQLKNGQAQAAVESLQKMRDLLQKATPEQTTEMLKDLAEALKPAEEYGEVHSHLDDALGLMKNGKKADTDKSLGAAQEALEKMLNELGDVQGLMASLQNLQKAQMCVGNGMMWSRGNSMGRGQGNSQGGKGYGTWSPENPWAMPDHIDDFWDNSGINRPDMATRGLTDRDAGMPDGLTPTKVKGQLQPGGPMPSITLRGVSIKGQSSVAYTEAATAAQSDARSALDQEKVPRAYQNAVRNYFDDIK